MQLVLQSQNLNFEETYHKLVASNEVRGLRRSGGGRGGDKTEHGNAVFSFKRLPEAKISISPRGTIQITVPASKREIMADSLQLVVDHLVMIKEERVKLLTTTFSDVGDKDERLKPPFTTERTLRHYRKVKTNIEGELNFVELILKALETRKKVVLISNSPTTGREGFFFGDWTPEQRTRWINNNLWALSGEPKDCNGIILGTVTCEGILKKGFPHVRKNTNVICLYL